MNDSAKRPPAPGRAQRLLLVNPNIVAKNAHMHIGLVTVASWVRAHGRHQVRIVDFTTTPKDGWRAHLRAALDDYRPDVVGMYVSSPYFPMARRVAEHIKRLTDAPLVAGGHHATLAPEAVLEVPHFDLVIEGEGERATVRLLDVLADGAPLADVPGLWYRERGGVRCVPKAPLLRPEEIPTLDWTLIGDDILRAAFGVWGILPVMASRGCPSNCSFCSITEVQKRYPGEKFLRFRDPRRVVTEIEADYARFRHLGLRTVQFQDLNFLLNLNWLREFTDAYREAGLNGELPWSAFTRLDHVTPAAIECLRDSGCVNLRVGIEAANPTMRNFVYRKNLSQEKLERALEMIKDADISITGYFMAGGPGERPEWLLESLDFTYRLGVDFPYFFLYKPLAGSEILDRAAQLGSRIREDADETAADFLHGVSMHHRHVSGWQLSSFVVFAHVLFSSRMALGQIRKTGPTWFSQMARYASRAVRMGLPLNLALPYFVFYGEDHLAAPFKADRRSKPSAAWRAMMAAARLVLPPSGAPVDESAIEPCAPDPHGDA